MKKILVTGLFLFLYPLCSPAESSLYIPKATTGKFGFGLETLYLTPSPLNLDIPLEFTSSKHFSTNPITNDSANWGYRISFSYEFPGAQKDVELAFTSFQSETTTSINHRP